MFVTGTEDHRGNVQKDFEACPGRPKVFAQVAGAAHMEPKSPGRLNQFDAHFMGCHVAGLAASCDKVYGSAADGMCQAQSMTACEVVGAPPVPGPPAPPPSSGCTFSAYGEGVSGTQIGATLPADTKEACCALCRANAACKSAGWRNATADGKAVSPVCHLKDCAPDTCGAKVAGVMTCTPNA